MDAAEVVLVAVGGILPLHSVVGYHLAPGDISGFALLALAFEQSLPDDGLLFALGGVGPVADDGVKDEHTDGPSLEEETGDFGGHQMALSLNGVQNHPIRPRCSTSHQSWSKRPVARTVGPAAVKRMTGKGSGGAGRRGPAPTPPPPLSGGEPGGQGGGGELSL